MLVRCPSCRETFATERTGVQDCPLCGKPLAVPEPATIVSPPSEGAEAVASLAEGTPWERRDKVGAWSGWRDTVVEALFEPAKLFGAARIDRAGAQVGFAVVTFSVFAIVGQMVNRFALGPWRQSAMERLRAQGISSPLFEALFQAATDRSPRAIIVILLVAPLVALVWVYLNAAVTHGFAVLFGQNRRGFAATFAACSYACAPLVFLALPGCGDTIGAVWAVILTGIGLKHMHGIRSGGATATVLGPYALWCCGTCALAALIGAVRGGMGH